MQLGKMSDDEDDELKTTKKNNDIPSVDDDKDASFKGNSLPFKKGNCLVDIQNNLPLSFEFYHLFHLNR